MGGRTWLLYLIHWAHMQFNEGNMKRYAMAFFLLLSGCTTSHVMIGTARPPIPVEQVKIYLHAPSQYEEIAVVDASSKGSFAFTQQQKTNRAVDRLKEEAASLGANGILFEGSGNESAGSVGVGQANVSGNTAFGVGVSGNIMHKVARGIAIYVPENAQAAASNTVNISDPNAAQKLRDLQKLKDDGLITDTEYQTKRKLILDSF